MPDNKRFWYINWDGKVYSKIDEGTEHSRILRRTNNYFYTENEALIVSEILLKALKILKSGMDINKINKIMDFIQELES